MNSYRFLAGCYDQLTYDVRYPAWADYIEKHFRRQPLPGRTVLDLACGTGSLTRELALRGYEMIGVDQSPEMLAEAAEKNRGTAPIEPIFLCQPMERLDLYGTIDACVCKWLKVVAGAGSVKSSAGTYTACTEVIDPFRVEVIRSCIAPISVARVG